MNSDFHASGSPSDPLYQTSLVAALPVSVLPIKIAIAPPADDAVIRAANDNISAPTPVPTAAPTQAAGLPGEQLPGGINPAIFSGLS